MKTRVIALTTALVWGFVGWVAWRQNMEGAVGGPISGPKCAWLALAITVFIVVPGVLACVGGIESAARRRFGWVVASFLLRGVIEIPMLHCTRAWRCEYGIAHDLVTLVLVADLWWRLRGMKSESDRLARQFASLLAVTLGIEVVMAWLFHRVASPAAGVYYAADSEVFQPINRFTLLVVLILWPTLIGWWWRAGKVKP